MTDLLSILGFVFLVLIIIAVFYTVYLLGKDREKRAYVFLIFVSTSLDALQKNQAAGDADEQLPGLIERLKAAEEEASAAFERKDYAQAIKCAEPVLRDVRDYRRRQDQAS